MDISYLWRPSFCFPPLISVSPLGPENLEICLSVFSSSSPGGVIWAILENSLLVLETGSLWDVLMPQILTVLGHKHRAPLKIPSTTSFVSCSALHPYWVAFLFGLGYNIVSQGLNSGLSFTKGTETKGVSTHWESILLNRKWAMKVIGTNSSFILFPWTHSSCSPFLNTAPI